MSALTVKYNIFFLNSKSYKTKKVLGVGNCQICASVQNCTTGQIARRYFCTMTLLHEWIKLHEDLITRRFTFARKYFCTS